MGNITGRFLLPHPPAAIPEIGGERAKTFPKTLAGYAEVGKRIAALKPTTIVVITPRGPHFSHYFYLPETKRISGDLAAFGAKKTLLGFDHDLALTALVKAKAAEAGLSAGSVDTKTMKRSGFSYDLDHGVIVPLCFLNEFYRDYALVPVSAAAGYGGKDHYRLGLALAEAVRESAGDVVVIASTGLSHRHNEEANRFDADIQELLERGDAYGLLDFDVKRREKMDPYGLNAMLTLLGTVDGHCFATELISYENNENGGGLVAEITPKQDRTSTLQAYLADAEKRTARRTERESFPLRLARQALALYLKEGTELALPAEMEAGFDRPRGGVFVTIKKDGQLRGIAGTLKATQPSLAEEIITNVIAAATGDSRFPPVDHDELDELDFCVDVLSTPEEVDGEDCLDPQKYGVIVESRGRLGVILPDPDSTDSPQEQLKAARESGNIHPWRRITIKRFGIIRYE